jgi:hypothetical protein
MEYLKRHMHWFIYIGVLTVAIVAAALTGNLS